MTNTTSIKLDVRDRIATITLNRPEVRNAIDDSTRAEFVAIINRAREDAEIQALVITGEGKSFCSGGDIKAMRLRAQAPTNEIAFNGWTRQQQTHHAIVALHDFPKPTIAAVNGPATGLGADLAMSCDFIIASPTARFAWSYVLRGLIPDGGGLYFLPRRIGLAKAKELIFTGRTVEAEEALSLCIIDRLVMPDELLQEAQTWAASMGNSSKPALALGKAILNQTYELSLEQVFALGSQAQAICYTTREHQQAIAAFLNKSTS